MMKKTICAAVAAMTLVSSTVNAGAEELGLMNEATLTFEKIGGYTSGMSCLDGGVLQ